MDLIRTSLPGQFQEIHSPDKLSDHDVVSGTLKVYIPHKRNLGGRWILYQKGDFESMRKDASDFSKDRYMVTRIIARFRKTLIWHFPLFKSLLISISPLKPVDRGIFDPLDNHWDKKIRRRNKTHAKAKKTGSR